MSRGNYTQRMRELIRDPAVVEEFDNLIAFLKGEFDAIAGGQTTKESESGLDDGTTKPITPADSPELPPQEEGIRWMRGPWLLNADGDSALRKGCAAVQFTVAGGTYDDWGPDGIDTAVTILLYPSTGEVTLRGIKRFARQSRFLFIANHGAHDFLVKNEASESSVYNRFSWGSSGDIGELIRVPTGQMIGFFYNTVNERWKLIAVPPVGSDNLPTSMSGIPILDQFPPHNRAWFMSFISDSSMTMRPTGEGAPTAQGGGVTQNASHGFGAKRQTGIVVNDAAGYFASSSQVMPKFDPDWQVVLRTEADISSILLWVNLETGGSSSGTIGGGGTAEGMGFRYSPADGDTGWVGVCRDGTTQSITTTVAAIAANTVYRLRVRKVGTSVFFSVNGGTEVEHTTNLPQGSTALFWDVRIFTKTTALREFTFFRHWLKFCIDPP